MENIIKMTNELLNVLGRGNIKVTDRPVYHWNGNTITDDETAPMMQIETYRLREDETVLDFIESKPNNKIIFMCHTNGKLVSENNTIRVNVF
jgi:hypothetical protein